MSRLLSERGWWYGLVAGCAGDVLTTWYGISAMGITEKNPVLADLMASLGVLPTLVLAKLVVIGGAVVLSHTIEDGWEWTIVAIPTVLYAIVTILNLITIFGA